MLTAAGWKTHSESGSGRRMARSIGCVLSFPPLLVVPHPTLACDAAFFSYSIRVMSCGGYAVVL